MYLYMSVCLFVEMSVSRVIMIGVVHLLSLIDDDNDDDALDLQPPVQLDHLNDLTPIAADDAADTVTTQVSSSSSSTIARTYIHVRRPTYTVTFTIDHCTLLNRLNKSFGISGCALAWIESYLSERNHCVRAGQASSPRTLCHTGVSQGSVLGPLLFSCYIAQISSLASAFGVNVQQYADDT